MKKLDSNPTAYVKDFNINSCNISELKYLDFEWCVLFYLDFNTMYFS